jgi:MFS family permease
MPSWFVGEAGRARLAVVAIFLVAGFSFSAWAVRIPDVKGNLRLDDATLGLSLLGMAAGAVVAMTASGLFIARLGSRRVTTVAALLACATMALPPAAPSAPALFGALFLYGAAYGTMDVAMNAQAVLVEAKVGRPIMSSFHGMFSAGALFGSFVAALVAGAGVAPVPHLLATGIVLAVAVLLAAPRLLPEAATEAADGPVFALPTGPLAGIGAVAFCVLLAEGAVADWSAVFLRDVLDASAAVGGWGFTAFSLTMAIGRFAGDGLIQRLGPVRVVRWGGVLVAAGLAVALLAGAPAAALVGFALVGAGLAATFPIALSAAGRVPGVPTGTAIAAVATAGYTGFLVGPPAIGFVSAAFGGLRAGLAVVALLGVVIALLAAQARHAKIGPHAGHAPAAEAGAEL